MPTAQTIVLLVPSVVVTKGDPQPFSGKERIPYVDDGRWTGCSNPEIPECVAAVAHSNIRALVSSVGGLPPKYEVDGYLSFYLSVR